MRAKINRSDPMKKKNERNAIPEETKNELKPETESCVKLTDEQMAQVSGGAGPHPGPPSPVSSTSTAID